MTRYLALVPAAGSGSRFGGPSPKQYLQLNGRPLMWHTLQALSQVEAISEVVLVLSPGDEWFDDFDWDLPKLRVHRVGGASRAESVRNGLEAMAAGEQDWVLVHDAARCCLSVAAVERLIATLADDQVGGLLALPVPDTVKRADAEGRISATVPRQGLWLAQTPQMFRAGLLARALAGSVADEVTDEASAIERHGHKPRLVEGDAQNFKVTYPRDLALARAILASRKD
ncbi:2-C-methyl-D-erythritol 4-phosphate cytidylyltransferase [Aquitalea magnusonii]|jgi:2-C-methyl-D-erythritol 4-phosphate cytidylyltransferase|uniref:2-C-methyl-D-erythritol 4-phosphate cytidylyltransferase n=1 Tax=Aquitalea magnusonii TaxID=332411 RepID=A0A3G9GBJ2_9NEIS|nr:2-C-methyl-D-erythritol 4-phosphate cytidylyltransferase [Aquitalea magnusonii]BBF84109.1 2-C-methyl-D-erythritol 4-phosphate cytidylyltransferase [Aquitalea magnusonii]